MALEEYVGAIVLEVDGKEAEVVSVSPTSKTGKKPVSTMNRTGRVKGFARGIESHEMKVTVVIPLSGDEIDWWNMEGGKLTIFPVSPGGKRVSYQDCVTIDMGDQYTADNEARRDLSIFSTRRVEE
ncbi:phage tail protein [Burkholderia cenocepacia]|uniref:phage tail protein n=1 Tax=Burkholderia cenocepacia TaxID=95486 RepID=UPI0020A08664|nr:phage tail protein [Burkholderia cenocepacia]MCO8326806.1 phage tail protein [Burkholderia cenocepacia]MCO8333869.1 phage tail protein [Burkholderia cenocepacia]MCO8341242.1 phage tail protein [Burkholderia cenocepacia]MCO8348662.1 phage tail protein [Burkholderia cenocepacia]MCO8361854.1 phage tail protein [Burkholderia cenocepacia]